MEKMERYELLLKQVRCLAENERDDIALWANVAALIHHAFSFWWTGFYRVVGDELVLGPFQGPAACTRIARGRGVCGTAWQECRSIVVPDVEQFDGHIACSSQSRSEIVVPLYRDHRVVGVLDIDSDRLATFDETDRLALERVAAIVMRGEKELFLAGGCFWGMERYLKCVDGVLFTETGYANGLTKDPTYEEVYSDRTGYAETVHLCYDANRLALSSLVDLYFRAIDPTSLNQQGEDRGSRYRTGVYYRDVDDRAVIAECFAQEARRHVEPLRVELLPIERFCRAEEYHQDYLAKHPDGYCHLPEALFDLARRHRNV